VQEVKKEVLVLVQEGKKEVIVVHDFSIFFCRTPQRMKFSNLWFRWHCELLLTAGRSLLLDVSFKIVGNQFCMG